MTGLDLIKRYAGKHLLLAAIALPLMLWLFRRRPTTWRPELVRPFVWHECACCHELVRPAEIMCGRHWTKVPVPIRMALLRERPGSTQWLRLANKAIDWRER